MTMIHADTHRIVIIGHRPVDLLKLYRSDLASLVHFIVGRYLGIKNCGWMNGSGINS